MCTYNRGMDIRAGLVDPLEGKSDHAAPLRGSGVDSREQEYNAREEQRELNTELHNS